MAWTDASLDAHVKAWQDCALPLETWGPHASHLATTVWHLKRHPFAEALQMMRTGIQRFNASVGKSDAYHDTVTIVYVHMVNDAIRRLDRGQGVAALANEVIEDLGLSPEQRKAMWARYYSDPDGMLKSEAARKGFVPPDLQPLPRG